MFPVLLVFLSEFGESGVLLLESLDLDLQLHQSLPQLPGLDLLAWRGGNTHTHTHVKLPINAICLYIFDIFLINTQISINYL